MNKQDRKELDRVHGILHQVAEDLGDLADRELEKLENLPDSLQTSGRGDQFQEAADELQELSDDVHMILSRIDDLQGGC